MYSADCTAHICFALAVLVIADVVSYGCAIWLLAGGSSVHRLADDDSRIALGVGLIFIAAISLENSKTKP